MKQQTTSKVFIPDSYVQTLSLKETEIAIKKVKDFLKILYLKL